MKKNLTICLMLMMSVLWNIETNAQVNVPNSTYSGAGYVGTSTAGGPLPFVIGGTSATPLMLLTTGGNFGIGNIFTPTYKLDVDAGDINLNTFTNAYRIGDGLTGNSFPVLWHNGNTSNIFVGVGAGIITTGNENTITGYKAGFLNTTGYRNTFNGHVAGYNNSSGFRNTFLGDSAGYSNTTGYQNTFVGVSAGLGVTNTGVSNTSVGYEANYSNTTGNWNTIMGRAAGKLNTTGSSNSFYGKEAGMGNTVGEYNVYVGSHAGQLSGISTSNTAVGTNSGYSLSASALNTFLGMNSGVNVTTGFYNTYIGAYAQSTAIAAHLTLQNSAAIGYNTEATADNQMILGNNSVNVGIGLSGDNNTLVPHGPRSKLEINAGQYGTFGFDPPPTVGSTGYSGLQFRDLTDICATTPNLGLGVLAVDNLGKVIYVPQIGNDCGAALQRVLTSDFVIPLDQYNYYFDGQRDLSTNVIVGSSCINTYPYAKFQSYQNTFQTDPLGHAEANAGLFYTGTNNKLAIGAVGIADRSEFVNMGLKGIVREYIGAGNYGVLGTTVSYPPLLAGNMNVGVYGYANWAGGHASTHLNYGVVGDLGIACPNPPCPGTAPDAAGYFNGDVQSTTAIYVLSDSALKENIQDVVNPMDIISQLNPKSFTFKQQQNNSMILPKGTHYGILAQDLANVLPGAVKQRIHPARYDSLGNIIYAQINFLAVNNMEVVPFLIGGMKQQQQTIIAMQAQIDNLSSAGQRHTNPGGGDENGKSGSMDVELKNVKGIVLNQNVPNPFAEQTLITFNIPEEIKKAQIFFYDNKGDILKIVDIIEKGAGQLNVYAADLSSGAYTYSLIADQKVVETKKMVKTN